MRYVSNPVKDGATTRELQNIALTLQSPEVQYIGLAKTFSAPARPFDGMIVYADGATWNPGAGEGIYAWHGAAWNLLG